MEINKQSEIYDFLKSYTEEKGYPPTIREICEEVSLKSTSTVYGHLKRLEKKGLVKREPTKPRALEINEVNFSKKEMLHIPIIKKVNIDRPMLAAENIEDTFSLPLNFIKHDRELFVLKVTGESMINVGIFHGDFAIIEKTENVSNGDIILAILEEGAIIHRFFKEKEYIKLQPENDCMKSIWVNDCKVVGKLVGIFRKY